MFTRNANKSTKTLNRFESGKVILFAYAVYVRQLIDEFYVQRNGSSAIILHASKRETMVIKMYKLEI